MHCLRYLVLHFVLTIISIFFSLSSLSNVRFHSVCNANMKREKANSVHMWVWVCVLLVYGIKLNRSRYRMGKRVYAVVHYIQWKVKCLSGDNDEFVIQTDSVRQTAAKNWIAIAVQHYLHCSTNCIQSWIRNNICQQQWIKMNQFINIEHIWLASIVNLMDDNLILCALVDGGIIQIKSALWCVVCVCVLHCLFRYTDVTHTHALVRYSIVIIQSVALAMETNNGSWSTMAEGCEFYYMVCGHWPHANVGVDCVGGMDAKVDGEGDIMLEIAHKIETAIKLHYKQMFKCWLATTKPNRNTLAYYITANCDNKFPSINTLWLWIDV